MKTKYTEPTEGQTIDFYYVLFAYLDMGFQISEGDEHNFFCVPNMFTAFLDDSKHWPRETSPEVYEYYVSAGGLDEIKEIPTDVMIWGREKCDYYKHKIKITVCEDK